MSHGTCESPVWSSSETARFGLSIGDEEACIYESVLDFFQEPTILSIIPSAGPILGMFSVSVIGVNFQQVDSLSCNVGGLSNGVGQWWTSSVVKCTMPSLPPGNFSVQLSMDGVDSSDAVSFSYIVDTVIRSVTPSIGFVGGGLMVTLAGEGLLVDNSSFFFGRQRAQCQDSSDISVICKIPANEGGYTNISLGIGRRILSQTMLQFLYVQPPKLASVSPSSGHVQGRVLVTIIGEHFLSGETSCRFGQSPATPADVLTSSSIRCFSPASSGEGVVDVAVSVNGVDFSESSAPFSYRMAAMVSGLRPMRVSMSGGTMVTVFGSYMAKTAELQAMVGSEMIQLTYISSSMVTGLAPPLSVIGNYTVSVSNNGWEWSSEGLAVQVVGGRVLQSLDPSRAHAGGSTIVTVVVSGFVDETVDVMFGKHLVTCHARSDSRAACDVPESSP